MQENKEVLIVGEVIAVVVALWCMGMLFFRTFVASTGFLGLACLLLAIYLATVRGGLKG